MTQEAPKFCNLLALDTFAKADLIDAVTKANGNAFILIHLFYLPEYDADDLLGSPAARREQEQFGLEQIAQTDIPVIFFEEGWRFDQYVKDQVLTTLANQGAAKTIYHVRTEAEDPTPDISGFSSEERWQFVNYLFHQLGITNTSLLGRAWIPGNTFAASEGCVANAASHLREFNPTIMPESDLCGKNSHYYSSTK